MNRKKTNEAWQHGAVLAVTFGMSMRFIQTDVTTGSSESDEESTFIAIYPERYAGSGGGFMRATMEGMPVFEMDIEDREQAGELTAALNYFSIEGRTQ